jgi:hypothetical protein
MLVDDSASATVRQLGDALTETEVNGHFFGHCSLTLVLHGTEPRALQQHTAEASKAIAIHDGAVFEETYNLLNAWLSVIPGNGCHNLRRLVLLETNAADLSFIFTLDQGDRVNAHLQREALAIFETPHHTPYSFNLHVQDVGHTLVLGATGSGKSFLLNFIVTHAQKYEPLTVILDLGHSYRKLATLLGGSYLERHDEAMVADVHAVDQQPDQVERLERRGPPRRQLHGRLGHEAATHRALAGAPAAHRRRHRLQTPGIAPSGDAHQHLLDHATDRLTASDGEIQQRRGERLCETCSWRLLC